MALPFPDLATSTLGVGVGPDAPAVTVHVHTPLVVALPADPVPALPAGGVGVPVRSVLVPAGLVDVDVAEPVVGLERRGVVTGGDGGGLAGQEGEGRDGREDGGGGEHHFD